MKSTLVACLFVALNVAVITTQNTPDTQTCNSCCQGPSGIPGIPGAPGNHGNNGMSGPAGPSGNNGLSGLKGDAGPTGDPGERGEIGPSGVGEAGPQGPRGPPGKMGPSGPTGLLGPSGPSGDRGEPGIPAPPVVLPNTTHVAFYAVLNGNIATAEANQVVIFDSVMTNVGNTFDQSTGKFTCPINGVYWFSYSANKLEDGSFFEINLMKDQEIVALAVSTNGNGHQQISQSALLELNVGSQVWLAMDDNNDKVYGAKRSTFAGYLLFEI